MSQDTMRLRYLPLHPRQRPQTIRTLPLSAEVATPAEMYVEPDESACFLGVDVDVARLGEDGGGTGECEEVFLSLCDERGVG